LTRVMIDKKLNENRQRIVYDSGQAKGVQNEA